MNSEMAYCPKCVTMKCHIGAETKLVTSHNVLKAKMDQSRCYLFISFIFLITKIKKPFILTRR